MKHETAIFQFPPSIFSAVAKNDFKLLTELLKSGESINQHRSVDGFTPIFVAVSHNTVFMLQFLLDNGAIPWKQNWSGMTALDLALSSVDFDPLLVKRLLIASGADSIQEKFAYYKLARAGAYDASIVHILRTSLDISKKELDSSYDESSYSAEKSISYIVTESNKQGLTPVSH